MALPPEADALLGALKKMAIRAAKTAGAALLDQSLADAEEVLEAGVAIAEHYRGEARAARDRVSARSSHRAPVDPVPNATETACPDCLALPGKPHLKICPRRSHP